MDSEKLIAFVADLPILIDAECQQDISGPSHETAVARGYIKHAVNDDGTRPIHRTAGGFHPIDGIEAAIRVEFP
jgi:hypothetical protein